MTASTPFVASDNEFLWFCLTCRESGIAASVRLGIEDEVRAFDIDNACSLRLLRFDTQIAKQNARLIAYEVSKIFSTSDEAEPANVDADTEVW